MDKDNRDCKSCGDRYRVTEEQIARILASPAFQGDACVSDGVYQARLHACADCPKLLGGGMTCAVCGCIVPVVAKLKERSCPLPGDDRWRSA